MMFVSLLPALFYYIGYSLMLSSGYGRQKEQGGGGALLGMGLVAFSMLLTYVGVTFLSRIREYYADNHSATIVQDGPRKLSDGLAKIVHTTKNMARTRKQTQHLSAFKALFIADPDHADIDSMTISATTSDRQLVEEILSRKLTTADRIAEIFSTHPNIIKRIKALQEMR
jgi:heat shock protein HtpX